MLVVTEGLKTETAYFKGLRYTYRISTMDLRVLSTTGTDPVSIETYAEKLIKNGYTDRQGKGFDPKSFERVFVVFDQDKNVEGRKAAL